MSEQEMIVDRMGLLDAAALTLTPNDPKAIADEIPWRVLRPACEMAERLLKQQGYKVFKVSSHPNARFRLSWPEHLSKPGFHGGLARRGPGEKGAVSVSCSVSVERVGLGSPSRRSGW
jgi:hypothetical protein